MIDANSIAALTRSDVPLLEAVAVLVAVAPVGYLVGTLFTVHVVGPEPLAVGLTTIGVCVLGLVLAATRS